jgi:hypothetical protein
MALVILGMAAAGVMLPFSSGAAVQAEGIHRTLAAKLAGDLMERIVATPYDTVVGTWNGYAEAAGQIRDVAGAVFADPLYARYSRDVACDYVYVQQQLLQQNWTPPAPNFIVITVRVCDRGRPVMTLSRLISR